MAPPLHQKIQELFSKRKAFVLYRFPGEEEVFQLVEAQSYRPIRYDEIASENGFVVFPFSGEQGLFLSELKGEKIPVQRAIPKPRSICSKEEYLKIAESFVSSIKDGQFIKLVLSRRERIPIPSVFDPFFFFIQLCENYPEAFVHIGHYPGFGTWAGASPEGLLRTEKTHYLTMSLAGTQLHEGRDPKTIRWEKKEKEEQFIVTKAIRKTLEENQITDYKYGAPYTHLAGHLAHIRADFRFKRETVESIGKLIQSLHPTPAVGGMPQKEAQAYIDQHEGHDRSLYSGFLGECKTDGEVQLFVNLRCMQIMENELDLFIGGGITADSEPEEEWKETEQKATILKRFLGDL